MIGLNRLKRITNMKLTTYIKVLQALYKEHGNCILFTPIDDEGNGYNRVTCPPEVRYLSPHEDKYRPDSLIEPRGKDEPLKNWIDNSYIDEEDIPKLDTVILL